MHIKQAAIKERMAAEKMTNERREVLLNSLWTRREESQFGEFGE